MSYKAGLLKTIRTDLESTLDRLTQAARDAHAAATDPDAKAESKYDTRSLEASYLASGQARQVDDTTDALRLLNAFEPRNFEMDEAIDAGALVETELDSETTHFLLAPAAGGLSIEYNGREVTLLTPNSKLYRALLGKALGDTLPDTGHLITELE